MINQGVKTVLVTLGSQGALLVEADREKFFPAKKVAVVDSTAAGDTFNGGFVSGLARGLSLDQAIDFGTKAAAISVTRPGAQDSIPTFKEVEN